MTSTTLSRDDLRATRTTVEAALRAGPFAPLFPDQIGSPPHFMLRASWRTQSITISWSDAPDAADVEAAIAALDLDPAISVVLEHAEAWSCGRFHVDQEAAWRLHVGPALEEIVGACSCCGNGGELEIPEAEVAAARAEGFPTDCRPGSFRLCPACGGRGRTLTLDRASRPKLCAPCAQRGVFDLDDPDQRAAYPLAVQAAIENYMATKSTRRRLP